MNKELIKKVLKEKRANLEDDAYRYEHFGGTEADLLIVAKRKRDIAEIDIALREI